MIDWTATGTMLTGIGTILSACAIAFAALIGGNRFDEWRHEKLEERRLDAAERILTLAYELRSELQAARAPLTEAWELDAAERKLASQPETKWDLLDENERRRLRLAQSALTRLSRASEKWQQIWTLKPIALAFFGEGVERQLQAIWEQYVKVRLSAEEYAYDTGHDREYSASLRQDMWGTGGENDEVAAAVNEAVKALESELRPMLAAAPKPPNASLLR